MSQSDTPENPLVPVAMQIIIHAGNARNHGLEAIRQAKRHHSDAVSSALAAAKKELILAHQAQTEVIQKEAAGFQYEPSLLFTHAQDHLMTISSELVMIQAMIELFEQPDAKPAQEAQQCQQPAKEAN
ncbi:PTS cellobiose transporter subunit IIA [Lacticaseibacillus rhamnosus]|uniref:PTS lactose/cellobiose transporter subunit IIA n=1 Tax=Lacticaseibacillus rhamnosus TaxID=47715 RepID=UPI00065ABE34|nr:PTS lactose/cellobiose transporter subunit IIA [Lacticaseibacillus rhamnosus]KMO46119.1 PTS cellobiose transporter subunit IIA [Lacticaseibacillus rhamnosus]OAT98874.1 PTS cellobiose transporter subunit IIA [Lacticaseibacillus rhamnosus]